MKLILKSLLPLFSAGLLTLGACGSSSDSGIHDKTGHHAEDSHRHDDDDDEDHHSHSDGTFVIEPERAAALGIISGEIEPSEFYAVVRTSGQIKSSASDIRTATARTSGIFTLNDGVSEGMKIPAGGLIGNISASGMQGGDVNAAAKANLDAAKKELDRLRPLYQKGLVTASVYNEAQRRYEEALALAVPVSGGGSSVTAPVEGSLSQLLVGSGQFVEAGSPIAVVAKNSRLTLRADLPERYFQTAPTIVSARFRPAYTDSVFSLEDLGGTKLSESFTAKDSPGYIPLYFSFLSAGDVIPGAAAEVFLIGGSRQGVISVPREALIELQGNKYVYVVHDGHAYEKRLVKTGESDGRRVEVISGISPGEIVVVRGATIARMAETSAIAPPGHSHNH